MAVGQPDPIPYQHPLLEGDKRPIAKEWYRWLDDDLTARLAAAPQLTKSVQVTGQTASISGTDLGVTQGGLYWVSWVLRVTTAATTSSSLTFSVSATDDALVVVQTGAAATGNTTTTVQSGVFKVQSDAASPITFSVAYASVGGTSMVYKISVVCYRVG